jgi:cyclohexanone monooxygenase
VGGRRVCLDTDYYAMFNRPNVSLIDVYEDPIERLVADGVKTRDSHYPIDALVLATGFDAMTGALLKIDVRGRGGRSLRDKWSHGPVSYLGIAIEGFPNFFTITGPGSPSVLTNVIAAIEQHVEWLADLFDYMERQKLQTVEADVGAEEAWVRHVYDLASTTLMIKANSWYLGQMCPASHGFSCRMWAGSTSIGTRLRTSPMTPIVASTSACPGRSRVGTASLQAERWQVSLALRSVHRGSARRPGW